jgi:hypothetical protein
VRLFFVINLYVLFIKITIFDLSKIEKKVIKKQFKLNHQAVNLSKLKLKLGAMRILRTLRLIWDYYFGKKERLLLKVCVARIY